VESFALSRSGELVVSALEQPASLLLVDLGDALE
jgi:hypothetical protein